MLRISIKKKFFAFTGWFWTHMFFIIIYISTAERNNVVSRRADEERRTSPCERRTPHLPAWIKNFVSRRVDEERHISPYTGHVLRYDVLRPRDEIRRSSSARRDMTFIRASLRRCTIKRASFRKGRRYNHEHNFYRLMEVHHIVWSQLTFRC